MRCLLSKEISQTYLQPATASTPVSDYIKDNSNWFPFFKDCIGAVDGTHIEVSPPDHEKAPFRNRKGFFSQNVLAVCNFDMRFTDVMVGFEGSAADSTLWIKGRRSEAVHVLAGKYLLGDAGFPNCDQCITPYRFTRYHLQEWARGNRRPQNKEELFNLRHSKIRNIIERIFEVMKNRFKILTKTRSFKMKAQVLVVLALCILHNILAVLREEMEEGVTVEEEEEEEEEEEINGDNLPEEERTGEGYHITRRETKRAQDTRDAIAEAMWQAYQTKKARRSGV